MHQGIVAESFETSVPWDRCSLLCRSVKQRVVSVCDTLSIFQRFYLITFMFFLQECSKRNISHYTISCRVTQTYDAGACIYFYFGFRSLSIPNPVEVFEAIEHSAREQILACGGSLSHHHGVGKIRSHWYRNAVTETGTSLYTAAKQHLDPRNIFALGNLLPQQEQPQPQKTQQSQQSTVVATKAKL